MDVSDFDFVLPPDAIAQRPAPRGTARLMTLDRTTGAVAHGTVADLPTLLRAGDLFVVNDTKVIPARIFGTDEKGRRTEFLLVERDQGGEPGDSAKGPELWRCLAKPGRRVKAGRKFFFEGGWEAEAHAETSRPDAGPYALRFAKHGSRERLLGARLGSVPLPFPPTSTGRTAGPTSGTRRTTRPSSPRSPAPSRRRRRGFTSRRSCSRRSRSAGSRRRGSRSTSGWGPSGR